MSYRKRKAFTGGRLMFVNRGVTPSEIRYMNADIGTEFQTSNLTIEGNKYEISGGLRGISFNNLGNKVYFCIRSVDEVHQMPMGLGYQIHDDDQSKSPGDFTESKSFTPPASNPVGIDWKPDGSKFWIACQGNNTIYQYSVSTNWDISTKSQDGSYSLGHNPGDLQFALGGSKFMISNVSGNNIESYTVGTDWDITGTVSSNNTYNVNSNRGGFCFNKDHTKMYHTSDKSFGGSTIHEHDLTTADDISTASQVNTVDKNIECDGIFWVGSHKPIIQTGGVSTGEKLYLANKTTNEVYEYDASTAFDETTLTKVNTVTLSNIGEVRDVRLSNDGTKLFVVDNNNGEAVEYHLSTAYDLSTISSQQATITGLGTVTALDFNYDGSKVYFIESGTGNGYEYSLSTKFDFSTASQNSSQAASGYTGMTLGDTGNKFYFGKGSDDSVREFLASKAYDLSSADIDSTPNNSQTSDSPDGITFNDNGDKIYVAVSNGNTDDGIISYSLSTKWSLASWTEQNRVLSFSNEKLCGIEWSSEPYSEPSAGTYMYTMDNTNYNVEQYELTTEFDLTTATLKDTFSVDSSRVGSHLFDVFFNKTGDVMYIYNMQGVSTDPHDILRYELSKPWEVSTASFVRKTQIADNRAGGAEWKPDGTKLFEGVAGSTGAIVREFDASTAFDETTLTKVNSLDISSNHNSNNSITSITFKPDGSKFYVAMANYGSDNSDEGIHEYDMSTAWDTSTASLNDSYTPLHSNHAGIARKKTGEKFFTSRSEADNEAIEHDLSTVWDITTASSGNTKSVTNPSDLTFNGLL